MMTPPTILVVEDEETNRDFIEDILIQERYNIVVAENGVTALRYIAQQVFDLAIVDLSLPDIRGIDIVKTLRLAAPDTVIIILTGDPTSETASMMLQLGVYDHLIKPYPVPDLQQSVRRALFNRKAERQHRELRNQVRRITSEVP